MVWGDNTRSFPFMSHRHFHIYNFQLPKVSPAESFLLSVSLISSAPQSRGGSVLVGLRGVNLQVNLPPPPFTLSTFMVALR